MSTSVAAMDGAPVILMYHRIAVERSDPWRLCVSPEHFAEHLDALRRHARVVALLELQPRIADGTVEPGSVAITFDDGYADNLLAAAPLLARHDAPATVFVTTGYTGGAREFWWDELDRLLLEPGDLPRTVTIALPDGPLRLDLGNPVRAGAEALARRWLRRTSASAPPSARRVAYRAAWERLHRLRDAERWRALEALREATRRDSRPRAGRRQLTGTEIRSLARSGLVEIGAHTVTHPALPLLPLSEQQVEIVDSAATLSELLGDAVRGFSYPHGRFTDDTVQIVRDAGLAYACAGARESTQAADSVSVRANPFALSRVLVPDVDGDALLRMIAEDAHAG